ncbi:MAG TPA: pentapeptide repeat-containing protein [Stellaceae bacterium]|jgi:uncharacterized protein YjbI with pentapeptide repeats|nr:pentapeptide repeat-containing protein [Stellaceae bacterium]
MPVIEGFVLDLSGARIRRTDLSHANLTGANLSHADLTGANLQGANLADAILTGTILCGADLSNVKNLTKEQLADALVDETTILPTGVRAAS